MSVVAASAALVLQCFFDRPTDGSVPADSIPTLKMPLTDALAESLRTRQPPLDGRGFVGEGGPVREWRFGQRVASGEVKVLRVAVSNNPSLPGPFAARYGQAVEVDGGARFELSIAGYCQLNPIDGPRP